jgi:AcrR family transcriptional regulator
MTPPPATTTRTLSTAAERREALIQAAVRVFAARGFHAAPTTEIAREAGISQAYLFRLFPTKLELAVAAIERGGERMAHVFTQAAAAARIDGEDVLLAMGKAYAQLVDGDRDVLLVQLHSHAAATETVIRDADRRVFAQLVELVRRESGADDATLKAWFAVGMLINVMTAIDADEVPDPWALTLTNKTEEPCSP